MLLQMALFHSFLWLSSIPLCICMCVCVYHMFFSHSGSYIIYHIYMLCIKRFDTRNWWLWELASPKPVGQDRRLGTQAGFLCYSLEAKFLLQEIPVFALKTFSSLNETVTDWILSSQNTHVRILTSDVIIFGDRVSKEVIKFKWSHRVGP